MPSTKDKALLATYERIADTVEARAQRIKTELIAGTVLQELGFGASKSRVQGCNRCADLLPFPQT
jgi:hypothetical protein